MIPETCFDGMSILNCREGDIKVSFDESNPVELARAQRIVEDMLKRGYILFVDEGDGNLKRVRRFNKKTNSYVIADRGFDDSSQSEEGTEEEVASKKSTPSSRKAKGTERQVPAKRGKAIAVGRTAGG